MKLPRITQDDVLHQLKFQGLNIPLAWCDTEAKRDELRKARNRLKRQRKERR